MSQIEAAQQRYWRSTLKWVLGLLIFWFLCSLGAGVLWVDALDAAGKAFGGGMGWGFWFAQQGSIAVFMVLLTIFVIVMNKLDNRLAAEVAVAKNNQTKGE